MFEKIVTTLEPFALTMVILSGANQAGWVQFANHAGWVQFANHAIVGYSTVFVGVALVVSHVTKQVVRQNTSTKKGK